MTPSAVRLPALMFSWAAVRSVEVSGTVAGHGGERRGAAAAIGNVDEVGAGHFLEHLHCKMLAGIHAGAAEAQAARAWPSIVRSCSLTVFGPVLGLATMTSGMSISLATGASSLTGSKPVEPGTWGLITSAPVAAIARVSPSGGAFARIVQAERAAGARLVLDVNLAAELRAELGGEDPADPVGRAARRERHDDLERLLRGLGVSRARQRNKIASSRPVVKRIHSSRSLGKARVAAWRGAIQQACAHLLGSAVITREGGRSSNRQTIVTGCTAFAGHDRPVCSLGRLPASRRVSLNSADTAAIRGASHRVGA